MNMHQDMVSPLRSLLASIDCPSFKARQAIRQAEAASQQAQKALQEWDQWQQGLLAGLEADRKALLAAAEGAPVGATA